MDTGLAPNCTWEIEGCYFLSMNFGRELLRKFRTFALDLISADETKVGWWASDGFFDLHFANSLPMKSAFLRRWILGVTLLLSVSLQAAEFGQRLANLSTRTQAGAGASAPIVGFVIGEGVQKKVLIRAIGPGLNQFPGVSGTLPNPKLELYSGQTKIAENDDWTASTIGGTTGFSAAGAFALSTGSRDAALLATLGPGAYTAQVTGVGTTQAGMILLEVYDVTGQARLMNLSTRAVVGTGGGILISGVAIAPGSGIRKLLVRAAGPTLQALAPSLSALLDPTIAIIDSSNVQIASNNDWGTENIPALLAAFDRAGAFPFGERSKDSALIADLAPGRNYTIQVSGVGGTTGIALIEVYDLTPENLAAVKVVATKASTDTNRGAAPAVFSVTRTGPTVSPLTVYYNLGGTAVAGLDYVSLPGSVTIPAGATSAGIAVSANAETTGAATNKVVSVSIVSGPGYALDIDRMAAITIFYNPGTLFVSLLRPAPAAITSTAYGTATIQLSPNRTFGIITLTFSNLSSPETVAYVRIGNPGEVGTELVRLPNGQVSGQPWIFQASGAFSAADLVQALSDGRIFVSVESASFPGGALRGAFIQSNGSLAFIPPAAAPAVADAALTPIAAARFLTQATFGPTKADIDALVGRPASELGNWITAQMALPASSLLDATRADFNTFTAVTSDGPQYSYQNRQAGWWQNVLTGPDQLRQRVAFALSQIFVVSDVNSSLYNNPLGMAAYYDILGRRAFGNFRQLLEDVTLSPVMGFYLSSLRNRKATLNASTGVLSSPDENYAREVLQLFTIGLNRLQPDGTLVLDAQGVPIPTYDQSTITELAKVFTGWGYASTDTNPSFTGSPANWFQPMRLYPAFHEDGVKTLFSGNVLPANQGGIKDLGDALDFLFNHPNTGPFISRQLIQRLVTSNPSPGYIYRAAQAFANNGNGIRGDLGAVVRAILMDYEVRSTAVAATASFGKLREPLLRAAALLRAFKGGANNQRFSYFTGQTNESQLGQTALHAPTVFNFYEPNYVQPGALANAGLFAPEYQILTDTTAISLPNQLWSWIYNGRTQGAAFNPNEANIGFVFDGSLLALARTPVALVDHVNLMLAAGGLPKAVTDRMVAAISALPNNTAGTDLERVRSAVYLAVSLPQGAIQK